MCLVRQYENLLYYFYLRDSVIHNHENCIFELKTSLYFQVLRVSIGKLVKKCSSQQCYLKLHSFITGNLHVAVYNKI